jgi:hypothetical protein
MLIYKGDTMTKKITLSILTALALTTAGYAGDDKVNDYESSSTGGIVSQPSSSTQDKAAMKTDKSSVDTLIKNWPEASKQAAQKMISKYGQPGDVTDNLLAWNKSGPWKRTLVYKNGAEHMFPRRHMDVLHQFVDLKVPVDKFDDLAQFDGSVIGDRTRGELSVRGESEEMNFMALNFAKEIIDGKKSFEQARQEFGKNAMNLASGKTSDYSSGFKFTTSQNAADPDSAFEETSTATGATSPISKPEENKSGDTPESETQE